MSKGTEYLKKLVGGIKIKVPDYEEPEKDSSQGKTRGLFGTYLEDNATFDPYGMSGMADAVRNQNERNPVVFDNNTYAGSAANAVNSAVSGTVGGIASMLQMDELARSMNNAAAAYEDQDKIDPELSWKYVSSPHGLTRSVANTLGSMATLAPAAALMPESLTAAIAARMGSAVAKLGGNKLIQYLIDKGMYGTAKQLATKSATAGYTGARWAPTALPEALAEGGNARWDALQDGASNREATIQGLETAALNLPILVGSQFAEGALLGSGLLNFAAPQRAALRYATAPLRGAPTALANAAQNGLEEIYQTAATNAPQGKEYGLLPWNYTDEQILAGKEGFAGSLPIGGVGSTMHAASRSGVLQDILDQADRRNKKEWLKGSGPLAMSDYAQRAAEAALRSYQDKLEGQTESRKPSPDFSNAGQGEGTAWIRQTDSVSTDGAKPQTLAGLDDVAQWFKAKTGHPLVVTSVTDGSSHQGGENSHYAGWKADVNDWGSGAEGALLGADGGKGELADEFIAYCQSRGIGANWEGDHIDLSFSGEQWEGPHAGTNFGGYQGGQQVRQTEQGGSDAPSNGAWEGYENAAAIYDVFRNAGYSDTAIAGILGRVQQEHNFDTSNVPEYEAEGMHLGGYGMFQWNGSRTTAFLGWAQENGLDPQDPTVQAQYALIEAQQRGLTPERMNGLSHEEAADVWTDEWEVGKRGSERQYAGEWLERIQNGGTPAGTAGRGKQSANKSQANSQAVAGQDATEAALNEDFTSEPPRIQTLREALEEREQQAINDKDLDTYEIIRQTLNANEPKQMQETAARLNVKPREIKPAQPVKLDTEELDAAKQQSKQQPGTQQIQAQAPTQQPQVQQEATQQTQAQEQQPRPSAPSATQGSGQLKIPQEAYEPIRQAAYDEITRLAGLNQDVVRQTELITALQRDDVGKILELVPESRRHVPDYQAQGDIKPANLPHVGEGGTTPSNMQIGKPHVSEKVRSKDGKATFTAEASEDGQTINILTHVGNKQVSGYSVPVRNIEEYAMDGSKNPVGEAVMDAMLSHLDKTVQAPTKVEHGGRVRRLADQYAEGHVAAVKRVYNALQGIENQPESAPDGAGAADTSKRKGTTAQGKATRQAAQEGGNGAYTKAEAGEKAQGQSAKAQKTDKTAETKPQRESVAGKQTAVEEGASNGGGGQSAQATTASKPKQHFSDLASRMKAGGRGVLIRALEQGYKPVGKNTLESPDGTQYVVSDKAYGIFEKDYQNKQAKANPEYKKRIYFREKSGSTHYMPTQAYDNSNPYRTDEERMKLLAERGAQVITKEEYDADHTQTAAAQMKKFFDEDNLEKIFAWARSNDNVYSIKALSNLMGVQLDKTWKRRKQQLIEYYGDKYTKWQEKVAEDNAEKERNEAVKQEQERQKRTEEAEKDWNDGKAISGDDFLLLCDKYDVDVSISTKGVIKNKLDSIKNDGTIYGAKVKKYPQGLANVHTRLKDAMEETAPDEVVDSLFSKGGTKSPNAEEKPEPKQEKPVDKRNRRIQRLTDAYDEAIEKQDVKIMQQAIMSIADEIEKSYAEDIRKAATLGIGGLTPDSLATSAWNELDSLRNSMPRRNGVPPEMRTSIYTTWTAEEEGLSDRLDDLIDSLEKQEKPAGTENNTVISTEDFVSDRFGSEQEATERLLESFGKKQKKFVNVLDDSDEALEKALAEFDREFKKLSANPMFNPNLMMAAFKVGGIYLQRGVNKFADWAQQMTSTRQEMKPFLPAVWSALQAFPADTELNERQMTDMFSFVGNQYDKGVSKSDIKKRVANLLGDGYEAFVDSAYAGVEKYPSADELRALQEGESNGKGRGSVKADEGRTAGESRRNQGSEEVSQGSGERREGVSERPGTNSQADSGLEEAQAENGKASSEAGNTGGLRSGVSGETGRQADEATGSRLGSGGRERGGEPGSASVGRGDGQLVRGEERGGNDGEGAGENGSRGEADSAARLVTNNENYHIEDADALLGGKPKVRFARNRKAIETFQELQATKRQPTQEEKDAMAAYTGWGSFAQELFQGTYEDPRPQKGWEKESEWLRDNLSKEEWESARDSTINAHYTAPVVVQAMWDMARRMGFKGGRVLEPSMGVGNFFGLMPKDMKGSSTLFGVEMDNLTGGIAKMLYPKANIKVAPYQEVKVADGTYDFIIGNVPFSSNKPADRRYDKFNASLHNYFFLKGIDELRPGGIMMAITTHYTMDAAERKVRMELAKKAELVDAYRFPTGAFKDYAGTDVVTDVLIFKKREQPLLDVSGEDWIGAIKHETVYKGNDYAYHVNKFFEQHPEKVLGETGFGRAVGRQPGLTVTMDAEKFQSQLDDMAKGAPEKVYQEAHYDKNIKYISNATEDRIGTLQDVNGELYVATGLESKPIKSAVEWAFSKNTSEKTKAERLEELKDLVKLRKAYAALETAEKNDAKDMEKLRKKLKEVFDAHVAKYCYDKNGNRKTVTRRGEKVPMLLENTPGMKMFFKAGEPNYFALAALEDKNGRPAKILTERVMRAATKDIANPTVREALMIQRNESMRIDIDEIAKKAKATPEKVMEELKGYIFKTPNGEYQVKDQYLSGNVRRKLREAQTALENGDESMWANIEALKKVMPEDIPYYNINVGFGGTWIDQDYYKQFIAELVGAKNTDGIEIGRNQRGAWSVKFDAKSGYNTTAGATTTYGTDRVKFDRLLTHALNHTTPIINTKDEKGNTVKDEAAIQKAVEQIEKIRETFADWVWKDETRKVDLAHTYNEVLNNTAKPNYDGSFLDMAGMMLKRGDKPFNLRKHQINAIYRGLVNGSGIYAHEVGTGKTYTMGGLALESRRFGLAKKPLILAHNANSAIVAKEIQEMYPGAKICFISGDSKNVKRDIMRVKNDDWDVVVMPHSKVDKLTLTEKTLDALSADIIAELEDDIKTAIEEDGEQQIDIDDPEELKKVRSQTVKDLVKQRLDIKENIRKNAYKASDPDAIPFEDLGVDMIIVDESHMFKKPPFSTRMNVKGLQKSNSQKSIQLNFLTQYVQGMNNGRGVHLFTGTPITNTLVEVYHNMKYVMPDAMKEANVYNFDDWFNAFASITSNQEYTSTGEIDTVDRLNSFVNLTELRRMVGQYMDIVFTEDMPEFTPRKTESGKTLADKDLTEAERDYLINGRDENGTGVPYMQTINEVIPMNDAQKGVLNMFMEYAKTWKEAGKKLRKQIMKENGPESPLYTENSVHKAAMDARLYNPTLNTGGMDSKEARVVKNVLKIYQSDPRTTQCIMMETGMNDVSKNVILRDDKGNPIGKDDEGKFARGTVDTYNLQKGIIKLLTEAGIPEREIAVVNGGTSAQKKAEIAEKVAAGEIRVVFGSTDTLGTGVNMQDNLKAIHHLDAPWMPGQLEQRNGRIKRQGNKWNTVYEYRYITEKLDGRRWQVLATKQKFIKMFMKAADDLRVLDGDAVEVSEDGSTGGDFTESLSKATGDPRFMRKANLENTVKKLEKSFASFTAGIEEAKYKLARLKGGKLDELRNNIQRLTDVQNKYAAYRRNHADAFEITIDGQKYDKRDDANKAITEVFQVNSDKIDKEFKVGEFAGFTLYGVKESHEGLQGRYYEAKIRLADGGKMVQGFDCNNSVNSITQKLARVENTVEGEKRRLEKAESDIQTLEKQVKGKFPREDVLKAKRKELEALVKDMDENPVPPPQWLVDGAPMQADVTVDGKKGEVASYRVTQDGRHYVGVKQEGSDEIKLYPWQEVMDGQGLPMITAPEGTKEAPAWKDEQKEAARQEGKEDEKTSSNRKYSLDNSDNIRDNVSEEVFDKYLTEGIMQMVQDTVSKEIGEYVDLSKMRDPVARDEARDKLPYIRNLLFQYNEMRHYAETKPEYLDRQAVKIEYARRCFDNADEIRREVARGLEQHTRSEGMGTSGNADLSGDDKGARRSSGARGTRGVSRSVGHEKHGAREHFEKLYNEQMAKHSNQGAFSNAKHFSIDGKPIVGVRKYSAAWHGSPHKFDTFSLKNIGTGEGAQVHGYGLYFAKERKVSEGYREELSKYLPTIRINGYEVTKKPSGWTALLDAQTGETEFIGKNTIEGAALEAFTEAKGDLGEAEKYLIEKYGEAKKRYIDEAIDFLREENVELLEKPGSLFQVEIPDEDVMLDEQKKFDEQPEKVQKALKDFLNKYAESYHYKKEDDGYAVYDGDRKVDVYDWEEDAQTSVEENNEAIQESIDSAFRGGIENLTGRKIYGGLSRLMHGDKQASEKLNDIGIKGITYEGGRDGRCYVVFDDQAIEIIQRLSVAKGKARKRSMDELKAEVKEAFPGAKVQESGNKLTFTMPNGQKVTVSLQGNITVNEQEEAVAKSSHGFDQSASVTIEGYAETVGAEGFIALSQGSRKGTGFHEAYHIAEAMAFTKKELADAKRLISDNEEKRADAYAKWKLARGKITAFGKLWQKIADVAAKLAGILGYETKRDIFRKVASGEIYRRENSTEDRSTATRYSLDANDNSTPGLIRRIRNILAGGRNNSNQERERMIRHMVEEISGYKVRWGKLDENTQAVVDAVQKIIRARNANDWESALPLAGKAIAHKLELEETETVGNYIAKWLMSGAPNDTSQEAKQFAGAMRKNPVFSHRLLDLQDTFKHWNDKNADERLDAIIQWTEPKQSLVNRMLNAKNELYDQFVEDLGPLQRAMEDLEKRRGKKLPASVNPYIAFRLYRGSSKLAMVLVDGKEQAVAALRNRYPAIDFEGFKTIRMILEECGALNNEKQRKDFIKYALACDLNDVIQANMDIQHEISKLQQQIAGLDKENDKEEIKELEATIDSMSKKIQPLPKLDNSMEINLGDVETVIRNGREKFGQAQQDLVRFSNTTLAILHDGGVISDKTYRNILKSHPNYVPMFRVFDEDERMDFGNSLKQRNGSTRQIINPLDSIIANTFDMVRQAEKNKAKQLLANLARIMDTGGVVEEVDNNKSGTKNVITFREGGQIKYLETDPSLVAAINAMENHQGDAFLNILRFVTGSIMRASFTVMNPSFALRNIFRDQADAAIYSKYGMNPLIYPVDFVRGVMHAVRKDEVYYSWALSGAAQASALSMDRNYTQSTINQMSRTWKERLAPGQIGGTALDLIQKFGEFSEYGTRIGVYERGLKEQEKAQRRAGKDVTFFENMLNAAYNSRDLMDFTRSGKAGRTWNKWAVFANASIQGWDKFFRTFDFRNDPKGAGRACLRLALTGVLPAFMLFAANWDKDWYKELPEWQKEQHWIIGNKDGSLIARIPKGQDLGVRFFSNLIEKGLERVMTEKPLTFKRLMKPLYDQTPDLLPSVFLPVIEAVANYSFFTGRSLVPQYQQNSLARRDQYGPYTSSIAKFLGEKLDVSPTKVDHLLTGYTGNVGGTLLAIFDKLTGQREELHTSWKQAPVIQGLMAMPYKNPQTVTDFYEEYDRLDQIHKHWKTTGDKPEDFSEMEWKRFDKAREKISELNKKEKALVDREDLDASSREALQVEIQKQRVEIAKQAMGAD